MKPFVTWLVKAPTLTEAGWWGEYNDNLGPWVSMLIQTLCPLSVREFFLPQHTEVNGSMSLWGKDLENPYQTFLPCMTEFFLLGPSASLVSGFPT